ncbi:hypothetical protein ACR2Q2_03935 [Pectobacterium versatile]
MGMVHDGTLLPPVMLLTACAIGALLSWWYASRQVDIDTTKEALADNGTPQREGN